MPEGKLQRWIAHFRWEPGEFMPVRPFLLEAATEQEAIEKALAEMKGDEKLVDVVPWQMGFPPDV